MAITFQNQKLDFVLKNKGLLRAWIKKVISNEPYLTGEKKIRKPKVFMKPGQINFVFTSDEEVLKANVQFLKHHTYTDIITFDYCKGNLVNGDILISLERVAENAKKFKVDFENELKRVMIHGVLHLCGYKDKNDKEARLIRRKENEALKLFGIIDL
jgi:rRNA maturation RNase YbeY